MYVAYTRGFCLDGESYTLATALQASHVLLWFNVFAATTQHMHAPCEEKCISRTIYAPACGSGLAICANAHTRHVHFEIRPPVIQSPFNYRLILYLLINLHSFALFTLKSSILTVLYMRLMLMVICVCCAALTATH